MARRVARPHYRRSPISSVEKPWVVMNHGQIVERHHTREEATESEHRLYPSRRQSEVVKLVKVEYCPDCGLIGRRGHYGCIG